MKREVEKRGEKNKSGEKKKGDFTLPLHSLLGEKKEKKKGTEENEGEKRDPLHDFFLVIQARA